MNYDIKEEDITTGLQNVTQLSGLRGRWERLNDDPIVICDTGHNAEAIPYLIDQLEEEYPDVPKHIIWGMVSDKDRNKILKLLPHDANYYTVKPGVIRGYDALMLKEEMKLLQLNVNSSFSNFEDAYNTAVKNARVDRGMVFIGGSTFLVADALSYLGQ